jgi:tetratricopeptide (TPR) repeat protein
VRLTRRSAPWLNAAAAVFAAALLPTLGLSPFNFQTFSTVADRYAYLAMFGVAIVSAVILSRAKVWMVRAVGACTIAGLGMMSVVQLSHWRTGWTLFDYTLKTNPRSQIVAAQLRFMLTPASEAECDLPPEEIAAMGDRLMNQKRSKLAAEMYRMAIARGANEPAVRDKLAIALMQNEQLEDAIKALRESLKKNPRNAEAHALLGDVLARSDIEAARREYQLALAIDPGNATARRGLSLLRPTTQLGS